MIGARRQVVQQLGLHAVLIVFALGFFFPFFWMLSSSLKPAAEIFRPGIHLFPDALTLENYLMALTQAPIARFLLNGVIVCGGILLGQLLVIVPAGFAFARLTFPGRDLLFALALASLAIPGYLTSIPNFLLLADLQLLNSYGALIFPFWGSAFGIFLMRQFFKQLPGEVLDAARIDGCNTVQLIWYVLLPLTRPALAAFAVFSIVAHWNDLFWPTITVSQPELYTPPAGIAYFTNAESGSDWGAIMAAATIIVTPLAVVFVAARKQFIQSLAYSAVKG